MKPEIKKSTGIDGNCPTWPGASAVYSKAYRYMETHGADDALIEALGRGDEEEIKANMLRINGELLVERTIRRTKRKQRQ